MSDNDMKIFSGSETANNGCANIAAAYELMNLHRSNGNLEAAKKLGRKLATVTPSDEENGIRINLREALPVKYLSQDILFQIKVLFVFAAETLLQTEISSPFLATTAINAMHDRISADSPGFYRNISDGAAFTFYCLALKKGGDTTKNIGEAFSMLCDVKKNRDGFVSAGETVWKLACDTISKEITAIHFQDLT